MGGVLEVAGVSGLLENCDQLMSASDRESQEWAAIVHRWREAHGGNAVTAKDLLKLAKEHDLLLDLWAGRSGVAGQQRFGHALRTHRDRVYGEWAIRQAGTDAYTRNNAWRLGEKDIAAGPDGNISGGVSGMVLDALGFDGGPPRDELVKRLRSGQAWLIRHQVDLDGPDEVVERFLEVLDQWDGMDEKVRRLGFEGCPIDPRGCPDETPAKCRHCGSGQATAEAHARSSEEQYRLFPPSPVH